MFKVGDRVKVKVGGYDREGVIHSPVNCVFPSWRVHLDHPTVDFRIYWEFQLEKVEG